MLWGLTWRAVTLLQCNDDGILCDHHHVLPDNDQDVHCDDALFLVWMSDACKVCDACSVTYKASDSLFAVCRFCLLCLLCSLCPTCSSCLMYKVHLCCDLQFAALCCDLEWMEEWWPELGADSCWSPRFPPSPGKQMLQIPTLPSCRLRRRVPRVT